MDTRLYLHQCIVQYVPVWYSFFGVLWCAFSWLYIYIYIHMYPRYDILYIHIYTCIPDIDMTCPFCKYRNSLFTFSIFGGYHWWILRWYMNTFYIVSWYVVFNSWYYFAHTGIHTYIHYITLHCITSHHITSHHITSHHIHTYIHTYIHTHIHTLNIYTNIHIYIHI